MTSNRNPWTRRQFLGGAMSAAAAATFAEALPTRAEDKPPSPAPAKPAEFTRKIKLGLIGCGGRGPWLANFFKQHGGYEVHAVADYFQESADKAGDSLGVDKARRFSGLSGYKRVLDSGVEAVAIVNIPRFHAEHARAAIEAGCHVYAAKPVAIDVPHALKVEAAGKLATQKGLCYLVDYQIPTDPMNITVAKGVHEGGLGKLMHIDSLGFSGRWADPARGQVGDLLRSGHWQSTIALSGDFITEYSIHTIDAVLWTVGRRPVSATGRARRCRPSPQGDAREVYLVTYEFDDGLIWTHRCQALNNQENLIIRCQLFGDQATALINYWGKSYLKGGPEHFGGGEVDSLYDEGAKRNIATFYQNIVEKRFENPTVQRAVDGALTAVLGREAALRRRELTVTELIQENKELELDLSGLKS